MVLTEEQDGCGEQVFCLRICNEAGYDERLRHSEDSLTFCCTVATNDRHNVLYWLQSAGFHLCYHSSLIVCRGDEKEKGEQRSSEHDFLFINARAQRPNGEAQAPGNLDLLLY